MLLIQMYVSKSKLVSLEPFYFQVYATTASVFFRGIPNITLVPLYDETFGTWQPKQIAFDGVLGHLGHDIDAVLTSWCKKIA